MATSFEIVTPQETDNENCRWVRAQVAHRGWTQELEAFASSLVTYAYATEASEWLSQSASSARLATM